MTDENKTPNADPDAEPDPKDPASNDAINRFAKAERRRREQAEAKLAEKEAELAEIKKAALSEAERKESEAYERGRAFERGQWEPQLKSEKTTRMVERALLSRKADPDSAAFLKMQELESEEDVIAAVEKLLTDKPHLILDREPAEPVPSQPGAPRRPGLPRAGPAPGSGMIPASQIRAWTQDPDQYKQHSEEISAAMREGRILSD